LSVHTLSAPRASWLLIQLALRRASNRMREGRSRYAGPLRIAGVGAALMANSAYVFRSSLTRVHEATEPAGVGGVDAAYLGVVLLTILLCNSSLLNKDLSRPDADLEWLLTLPASVSALYTAKIARAAVLSPAGWVLLLPFLTTLALRDGLRALSLVAVLSSTAALLAVLALWTQVLEAAGRAWLRSLTGAQAVAALLATAGVAVLVSPLFFVIMPRAVVASGLHALQGLNWLPFSECLRLISPEPMPARALFEALAAFSLQVAVAMGLGVLALWRLATRGFVLGRSALHGARGPSTLARKRRRRRAWLGGVAAKDLRWFWRDRSSLAEAGILTAACVAQIALVNALSPQRLRSPEALGAAAFACGATLLASTTTAAFRSEARACWILFAVPTSLARVLLHKATLWWVPAAGAALGVLAWGAAQHGSSARLLFWGAYALLGLAFQALTGTALAARRFEANAEPSSGRRMLASYEALLLATPVFCGFLTSSYGAALQALLLFGALATALVQSAVQRSRSWLEPGAPTPPGLRLSDGLIAALFLSLLEGALFQLAARSFGLSVATAAALAFTLAGALVVGATCGLISRRGAPGALVLLGLVDTRGWPALGKSLAICVPAALSIAIAHSALVAHEPWLARISAALAGTGGLSASSSERAASVAVALLVAPAVEELVFRGLIQRALRTSLGPTASVLLSSACFALVHPLTSMVPVFLGAICAALALELSGALVAAMLVHAAYNAAALLLWVG